MSYSHLSREEKLETLDDRTWAFEQGLITEVEFRSELVKLGYNATDIEELVIAHRPPAPENTDGDFD